MKPRYRCITNNPMLRIHEGLLTDYKKQSVTELYQRTISELRKGYRLLLHPLSGSIRPDQSPYKSILVTLDQSEPDQEGIRLTEQAVRYMKDMPLYGRKICWNQEARLDFQYIDKDIIECALNRNL